MSVPEILAPAGNSAALHAAVRGGADAVYLGLDKFNARRNADNFTPDALRKACDYAHLRGVRIYVALNTIVLPSEMSDALDCARAAYDAGVDAFIVQDIGLLVELRRYIPEARLHASTQMNIHSEAGVFALAEFGVSRVTLARELSLGEIQHLANVAAELGIQVEVFAHGALCVSYSGQCFMSSMVGGRSANRGLCAQACRLNYSLEDASGRAVDVTGEYLLSPKDLCSIDLLGGLARAGVSSLKIEGRMKSPEYVYSVVSVYRSVLDRFTAEIADDASVPVRATAEEENKLASAFSRGFTTAYLEGARGNEIMSYTRPNNRGQFVGRVKWIRNGHAGISCEMPLVFGDVIEFWTSRGHAAVNIDDAAQCGPAFAEMPIGGAHGVCVGDRVFRVRSVEAAFSDDEFEPRIPVRGSATLRLGKPLSVEFSCGEASGSAQGEATGSACGEASRSAQGEASGSACGEVSGSAQGKVTGSAQGVVSAQAQGDVIEAARTKAVTKEEVYEHISRMGQTPFVLDSLEIDLDENVGVGFSQIHKVRALALKNLEKAILCQSK